jgi:hypothetical protein
VTFATSQSFGTLCPSMDFVKINCRYGDIDFAASFNILHDILSGPLDLLGLTAFSSCIRPFVDTLEVNGATSNNTTTNQQDNYRIGKKYWKYVKSRKRETVPLH